MSDSPAERSASVKRPPARGRGPLSPPTPNSVVHVDGQQVQNLESRLENVSNPLSEPPSIGYEPKEAMALSGGEAGSNHHAMSDTDMVGQSAVDGEEGHIQHAEDVERVDQAILEHAPRPQSPTLSRVSGEKFPSTRHAIQTLDSVFAEVSRSLDNLIEEEIEEDGATMDTRRDTLRNFFTYVSQRFAECLRLRSNFNNEDAPMKQPDQATEAPTEELREDRWILLTSLTPGKGAKTQELSEELGAQPAEKAGVKTGSSSTGPDSTANAHVAPIDTSPRTIRENSSLRLTDEQLAERAENQWSVRRTLATARAELIKELGRQGRVSLFNTVQSSRRHQATANLEEIRRHREEYGAELVRRDLEAVKRQTEGPESQERR